MSKPCKKMMARLLAAVLLCACPLTAFAEDGGFMGIAPTAAIVFGPGGVTVDGQTAGNGTNGSTTVGGTWSVDANGIITTDDADNTVSGDGTGNGLHFTAPDTTLTVNGDTTVGQGILADGDLTITGDTGNGADSLTVTGDNSPGIDVGSTGTLTIDGGVAVDATGDGSVQYGSFPGAPYPGVRAHTVNIKHGKLTATGAPSDGIHESKGIDAVSVYVDGNPVTLPQGNVSTVPGGKGSATLVMNPFISYNAARETYDSDQTEANLTALNDAAMKYMAMLLDAYVKTWNAHNSNKSDANLAVMLKAFNALLDAFLIEGGAADQVAALGTKDFRDALWYFRDFEAKLSTYDPGLRSVWRSEAAKYYMNPNLEYGSDAHINDVGTTCAYAEGAVSDAVNPKEDEDKETLADTVGSNARYAAGYANASIYELRDLLTELGYYPIPAAK